MEPRIQKMLLIFLAFIVFVIFSIGYISNRVLNTETPSEEVVDVEPKSIMFVKNKETSLNNQSLTSGREDESVIIVSDNGDFKGESLVISKMGDTNNLELAELEGQNSAILSKENSKVNLKNSEISTDADGAYAIFSNGENSEITIAGSSVETTEDNSSSLAVANNGKIIADKSTISTTGNNSFVIKENSGNFELLNSSVDTLSSSIAKISGESNLKIDGSKLKCSGSQDDTMFLITDANAKIDLSNNEIENAGSTLFKLLGNETEENSVEINATNQKLNGNFEIDGVSKLTLNLTNSQYTGGINTEQTAKEVNIKLDKGSSLTLQGNMWITSLVTEDTSLKNISSNGGTIYYDATNENNSWLKGKTVYLFDGGKIAPKE